METGAAMTYVTDAALAAQTYATEIEQLLDRNGDGTSDSGVLTLAMTTADAMIDGYLSGIYDVPLSPVPPLITQIGCDIIRYLLWSTTPPDEARKRYDDAMSRLLDINKGTLTLVGSTGAVVDTAQPLAIGYELTSDNRTFTSTSLANFVGA